MPEAPKDRGNDPKRLHDLSPEDAMWVIDALKFPIDAGQGIVGGLPTTEDWEKFNRFPVRRPPAKPPRLNDEKNDGPPPPPPPRPEPEKKNDGPPPPPPPPPPPLWWQK